MDAVAWIEESLDWTRLRNSDGTTPIPPKELPWAGSKSKILQHQQKLRVNSLCVRENGLLSTRLYSENSTQGGLPRVYRLWAEERAAWLRKQTEQDLAMEIPPPATFAPEPLSAVDFA